MPKLPVASSLLFGWCTLNGASAVHKQIVNAEDDALVSVQWRFWFTRILMIARYEAILA